MRPTRRASVRARSVRAAGVAGVVLLGACGSATTANQPPTTEGAGSASTLGLTPIGDERAGVTAASVPSVTSGAPPTSTAASTTSTSVARSSPSPPAPTGQVASEQRLALLGLPFTDPGQLVRPALVVKIDNHPDARPQVGLERADIVIEEVVEGITRFFAVFQSDIPDVVGPVRSARTQDALLVPMLNRPLFAWSGGNAGVRKVIHDAPLVDLGAQEKVAAAAWYRDTSRHIPHNLFVKAGKLFWLAPPGMAPPPPMFAYRSPGAPPAGVLVEGAKLQLSGTRVEWSWDAGTQRWRRIQNGAPHVTASKTPVTAANVVLLEVKYQASKADANSPEAQTVGSGTVTVLTGGRAVTGTWTRADAADSWTLRDTSGQVIPLTPGQTWVELVPEGRAAVVGAGVDPASVPFPPK